jgi:hypothetical protein
MVIDEIKQICMVGAGTIGHQIALQCATHDYDVHLVDAAKEVLGSAQEKIGKVLEERVARAYQAIAFAIIGIWGFSLDEPKILLGSLPGFRQRLPLCYNHPDLLNACNSWLE